MLIERNGKHVATASRTRFDLDGHALQLELGAPMNGSDDTPTTPDCRTVHVCRDHEELSSIHVLSTEPARYALRFGVSR